MLLLQGTYNPNEGTATIQSCLPCDAGFYCKQPGLNATEGKCFAGYYCTGASPSPTPVSSFTSACLITTGVIQLTENLETHGLD